MSRDCRAVVACLLELWTPRPAAGFGGVLMQKEWSEQKRRNYRAAHLRKFWLRVAIRDNGCWEWIGTKQNKGYGEVAWETKRYLVHRLVYSWLVGPIPPGLLVLHRCDNPPCCNPAHLFLGTHTDNVLDMLAKGRGNTEARGLPGERSPHSVLTEADVVSIHRRWRLGETQTAIAASLGVTQATVWRILNGRSWRHVKAIA